MLIAFPSDDAIWSATVSMTNEDTEFPATNVQSNDPSDTSKSTTTSTVYSIHIGSGNITVVGLALINTNYTTGALASSGGAIASFVFPSFTPDLKPRNGWLDLRGLSNRTDDDFTVTLSKTGSAVGELGRICLVTEWQAPEILIDPPPVFGRKRPGEIENVSRGGVTWRLGTPWAAIRWMKASTQDADTKDILDQLESESRGFNRGFLFVPNEDVNDAWFAQVSQDDFEVEQPFPDIVTDDPLLPIRRFTVLELSMGLPPDLS